MFIRVHLAVSGDNQEVYAVQQSHDLHSVLQWTDDGLEEYDYGAIILPEPFANPAGYFGFSERTDGDLDNLMVSILGYPTTTPDHETMWGDQGFLVNVLPTQVFYDMETEEGMSGGPVFYTKGDNRYVVGIHNYGGGGGIMLPESASPSTGI
jgi:V8-like Glu-specific endopeptidase